MRNKDQRSARLSVENEKKSCWLYFLISAIAKDWKSGNEATRRLFRKHDVAENRSSFRNETNWNRRARSTILPKVVIIRTTGFLENHNYPTNAVVVYAAVVGDPLQGRSTWVINLEVGSWIPPNVLRQSKLNTNFGLNSYDKCWPKIARAISLVQEFGSWDGKEGVRGTEITHWISQTKTCSIR